MASDNTLITIIRQSVAFAEKDIHEQMRFKIGYVVGTFQPALINLGLFATAFFGFFKIGAVGLEELNSENFIAFTVLGALASTLFVQGYQAFQARFLQEKYWQTALSILASPLSPWAILIGVSISEGIRFSIVATAFLIVTYLVWPVGLITFLSVLSLVVLLYLMVSGLSMIRASLFLVNENVDAPLGYLFIGTSYLSCFYYPAIFLPSFLQSLAQINPVYFAIYLIRNLWLGTSIEFTYLLIVVTVAILSPAIGTYIFRKVWRNLDMTGYGT